MGDLPRGQRRRRIQPALQPGDRGRHPDQFRIRQGAEPAPNPTAGFAARASSEARDSVISDMTQFSHVRT